MSNIDLNEIVKDPKFTMHISSTQTENPSDANIRRLKDIVLFVMATLFIASAFIYCGYILLRSDSTADEKTWAMSLGTSTITALIGYLTGKHSG